MFEFFKKRRRKEWNMSSIVVITQKRQQCGRAHLQCLLKHRDRRRMSERASEQKMMKTFLRAYTLTIRGKIFWLISFYSHHHHHSTWSAYVNWHFFIKRKRNAERPSWWEGRCRRVKQKANKMDIGAFSSHKNPKPNATQKDFTFTSSQNELCKCLLFAFKFNISV